MSLRIAISGTGTSGLFSAVFILHHLPEASRDRVNVDIWECTREHNEDGAGLVLNPHVWFVVEHLGVANKYSKLLPSLAAVQKIIHIETFHDK
jgi:2-polyprenyl-6-methoxyphenol hydroxylase-like FAD-dependent oxidoreductase